ncbi:MAG TPA: zeta toxin family protein, partial [Anaerolineaceae bacterium]
MPTHPQPLVIGIAGGTGSGKSTVANAILRRVGAQHIAFLPHDAYYRELQHLSKTERARINFDHPDALESELLVQHILALKSGQAIEL